MGILEKYIKNAMKLVHKFSVEEVALLKILMIVVGLFLAKVFPVLLSANILIYVLIIILGAGVLMRNMTWK